MEYAAEGSYAPLVAIRDGEWKYIRCTLDPEQLFNLAKDPHELTNLASDPAHAATLSKFRAMADARWDLARFDAEVRESQAQRWVVYEALRKGAYHPWDYQPDAESLRAVHAQSHEPRHAGGFEALSSRRIGRGAPGQSRHPHRRAVAAVSERLRD